MGGRRHILGVTAFHFFVFLFNNLDTRVSSLFSLIDLVPGSSMDSTGQRPAFCLLISSRYSWGLALETRLDEFPRSWTLTCMASSL
jgi:hypothetical protein